MGEFAITADGLKINYEVYGQGTPALVFVHGWSCDLHYWHKQVSHFASQYTVVTIDLAGHGDSGLDRSAWTMPAFAQDVTAVVEKLGLTQVVLIGHSMGGTVMVEAAQQMPSRIIGLVGVDTFKNLELIRTQEEIDAFLAPFRNDFVHAANEFVRARMFVPASDSALVETIAQDMAAAPPMVAIGAVDMLYRHGAEVRAGLRAMQVPVVLINSDHAPTDGAAARRYGITVELMSGMGHFVMIEDAETFNALLEVAVQKMLARGRE